jgi:hypothetical protein
MTIELNHFSHINQIQGHSYILRGDENYPHSVNTIISGERANIILSFDLQK